MDLNFRSLVLQKPEYYMESYAAGEVQSGFPCVPEAPGDYKKQCRWAD